MKLILLPIFAFFCLLLPAAAQEQPAGADPDLPQPFDMSVADAMLTAPPFTRAINLSDSLILTGIAYIEGSPVVTILDKEKQQSYVVSETPNAQGWKLAETNATVQLNRAQAKIMVGTEIVTVRYSSEQLSPEASSRPAGAEDSRRGGRDGRTRRESPRTDQETMNRFNALSDEMRQKLRDEMMNSRERLQNASPDERRQFMSRTLERLEQEQSGR